jgi:subtilase family serine protease
MFASLHRSLQRRLRSAALVTAGMLAALVGAGPAQAQTVYTADFENATAPGFTNAKFATTPNGQRKLLGRYGNETATLTLTGLVPGNIYEVSVEAYAIDSWDGNTGGVGPDIFRVSTGSGAVYQTTFSAFAGTAHAYPSEYPGGSFAGLTGGTACGCGTFCWGAGPTIYPIRLRFSPGAASETVMFSGSGLQDLCDESWAIDNVVVTDLGREPDEVADECSDATLVDLAGFATRTLRGSTLDATPDVLPRCSGVVGSGPGVWYRLNGTGTSITASTCGFADFDTTMIVACGGCDGFTCVGANDDSCPGGGSSVTFCTQLGRAYYIWIGGYEGEAGEFDLRVQRGATCSNPVACSACTITIPAGAIAENEPACGDGYVDTFNGGCNSPTPVFSALLPGQTVSGRAGTYVTAGTAKRDTDWYVIELAAAAEVTLRGAAEFPLRMGLIDGAAACRVPEVFDFGTAQVARCETATVVAVLPAGRYYGFAAPSALSGVACTSQYYITLETVPVGACVIGSGCQVTTLAQCVQRGGAYQGDATACPDVGYFLSTTNSPFEDISTTGTVATVSDDTGVTVPVGFAFGFYDRVHTDVTISPNGYLTFGGDGGVPVAAAMGSASDPNAVIAPRWSNLVPGANSVRYAVRGSAPTRRFIAQWTSVPTFGVVDSNTFQAVLFEGDGAIEFRYGAIAAPRFTGEISAGVESHNGLRGTPVAPGQVLAQTALSLRRGNLTPPVAITGGPYTLTGGAGAQVTLDARGSFDPDGAMTGFAGIRSVSWRVGSLTSASEIPVYALTDLVDAGLRIGTPVAARLVVTDFDNLSSQDETTISYVNSAPSATAGGPYAVLFGADVTFAGSVSDVDLGVGVGEVITAEWDWRAATAADQVGDGFASGLTPTVSYSTLLTLATQRGTTIYLNVKDASGQVSSSATSFSVAVPNLVVEEIATSPAQVNPGENITIDYTVRNIGNAPANGVWSDQVYLNALPGGCGGSAFGSLSAPPASLAPGASYTRRVIAAAPQTVGDFKAAVRVDVNNTIVELAGEGNNCTIDDGAVRLAAPDLTVTGITGPADAFFGEPLDIGFIVRNTGAVAAAFQWTDTVYLSTNTTLDGSDIVLVAPTSPLGLEAGGIYSRSASVTFPADRGLLSGAYYLLVRTDSAGTQLESSENNNTLASNPIRVAYRSYPDLRVTSINAPAVGIINRTATIAFTVVNDGVGEARGNWIDRVYLSTDTQLQVASDIALAPAFTRSSSLAGGSVTYDGSVVVNIPDRAGTYYVLVRTDDANTIDENSTGGENNNVTASVSTISIEPAPKADLVVTSVVVPSVAGAGSSVVVEYNVSNQGNLAASGEWQEAIYVSRDGVLDAGDTLVRLSPANASPLAAGASYSRSRSIALPDTFTEPTDVFILVKTDPAQAVDEYVRTNNTGVSAALRVNPSPAPNLTARLVSGPTAATFGQPIELSWEVDNVGNRAANGSWRDQVVLSRDTVVSADDVPLGSQLIDGVSPFLPDAAPYTRTASFLVPLTGASLDGQYYLVVRTDINAAVAESNENDNDGAFGPFTVSRPPLPNLVASVTGTPANVSAGTTATITYTVFNIGAAPTPSATPWTLTIFETLDTSAGGRRETAANVTISVPIAAGESYSGTIEVPVAEFRSPSMYFSACADTTSRVIESDESDNCAFATAATPYRRPDLTITSVDAPSTAEAERTATVSWVVRNAGNGPAIPYWSDSVYLAVSPTSSSLILLANEAQTQRVEADGTYTRSLSVRIPEDLTGDYYFVVVTDTEDRVYETPGAEGNNRRAAAAATRIVQPARPNLRVASVGVPADGLSGTPMGVSYVITNVGEAPANAAWFERIYASRDRQFSSDDLQLGSVLAQRGLEPGESYVQATQLRYPIPEGAWNLIVVVDPTNVLREVVEGGESDNSTSADSSFNVTTFTAVVEADIEDAPAGTSVRLSGTAVVEGTTQPAAGVPVVVRVNVRGFERTFDVVADGDGRFAVVFEPGPTEGGVYNVAAGPAHRSPAASDSFRLFSYRIAGLSQVFMFSGQTRTSNIILQNLGDVPITGVDVALGTLPDGVTAQLRYPSGTTIPGLATLNVELLVSTSAEVLPGNTGVDVFVGSATPAAPLVGSFGLGIGEPRAELTVDRTSLRADMVLGQLSYVQFTVRNVGGAPTGPLTVDLPATPWLATATPRVMPSLASGEAADVVLVLSPTRSLALGEYPGTLNVVGTGTFVTVGFNFKAVSDARGDLEVIATDEFTYYDEANGFPRVRNATVNVYDHETRALVASAQTDESGVARFDALREAYYDIEFTSPNHAPSRELKLVEGGNENEVLGFMSRQVVRYRWTVVPTEITDEYRITIQAVFETNVPAPQVIIEPGYIDLRDQTLPAMIEYTVRNEGLITARNVTVPQTSAGGYSLIPLVSNLGDLGGGQRVRVPVLVVPTGRGGGCVHATVQVDWQLPCGPFLNGYSGTAYVYIGVCLGKPGNPPSPGGCFGCGSGCIGCGPGGNGNGPGGTYVGTPSISQPVKCKPCTEKCIKAAISCVLDGDCPKAAWDCGNAILDISLGKFGKCIARGMKCFGKTVAKWLFPPSKFTCICKLIRDCVVTCVDGGPNFPCDPFDVVDRVVSAASGGGRDDPPSNDPEYNYFKLQHDRAATVMAAGWYMFGTRPFANISAEDEDTFDLWRQALGEAMDENSPGAESLTVDERHAMMLVARPTNLTDLDLETFFDRYNRTLTYYGLGIFNLVDVPQGWETDFIQRDIMQRLYDDSLRIMEEVEAEGFEGVTEALSYAADVLIAKRNDEAEGVCATVKIQIDQTLTLTRSAFNATLEIENGGGPGGDALDNIEVEIYIRDIDGNDITSAFGIRPPTLTNLNAVDGTGQLLSGETGSASWILIPTDEAAPSGPTSAFVGGSFSYSLNGQTVVNPLFPVEITVLPNPNLQLSYFLEKEVFADDPFTPGIVEPSIPFSLGLLLKNTGAGEAKNVRIASSEPEIIENDKGLIIAFDIIGTRVGSQAVSPSLNVDLGDIAPFTGTNVAQWLMTSTLQGEFKSYTATFEHVDPLNDPRLSLIESVDIFGLRHVVRTDDAGDDTLPDFLTDDRPDLGNLPDRVHLSSGSIESVSVLLDDSVNVTPGTLVALVEATATPTGYFYIRIDDPFGGGFPLASVTRSDGKRIDMDWNAWQTSRIKRPRGEAPQPQRYIHIFDKGGDGQYTLTFNPDGTPPDVSSWKSMANHAPLATETSQLSAVGIELMGSTPTSEPRAAGIHELVVQFSEPVRDATFGAANVSILGKNFDGTDTNLTGITVTASTASDGSVGVIGFSPALPDRATYCISLVGVRDLAGNFLRGNARVRVAALIGDASGDQRTNNTDVGGVVTLLGTNPIAPSNLYHVRSDINTDGRIDSSDRALILSARGVDLRLISPACPLGREGDGRVTVGDGVANNDVLTDDLQLPEGNGGRVVKSGVVPGGAGATSVTPAGATAGTNGSGTDDDSIVPAPAVFAVYYVGPDLADLLDGFGIAAGGITDLGVDGWKRVVAPARFSDPANTAALGGLLASQGAFISPLTIDEDNVTSIVTDSLIVQFAAGVPDSWARQVLAQVAPAGTNITSGFAGDSSIYTVEGNFASGFDVQSAARTLASRGDVRAAVPDELRLRDSAAAASDIDTAVRELVALYDSPNTQPVMLLGDLHAYSWDKSFAPTELEVGTNELDPLMEVLLSAAVAQGRTVHLGNCWAPTAHAGRVQSTRSGLLRAAQWAQQRNTTIIHLSQGR